MLRREVEERPGGLDVTVRVLRDRLDLFLRLNAASPAELPDDGGAGEWVTARLSYGVVGEARQLLAFGDRVEVLSPSEVRQELARAAASVTGLYQRVGEGSEENPSSEGHL
ncbi:hypothetical protein AQJ84_30310 [Streptomyces resistomycificus]|nr:hypothetical protein AQJ84_30310 [Streptomyces resistomycificus]